MAVLKDGSGSEQTLEKILEQTNTLRESGSGTEGKITLPGNYIHHMKYTTLLGSVEMSNVILYEIISWYLKEFLDCRR